MTRVLVCGSRTYDDEMKLWTALEAVHDLYGISVIIEGGAPGADSIAAIWGEMGPAIVESYPADWDKHGKVAGPIRNTQMLVEGKPDLVLAFIDKPLTQSRGTYNMVTQARKAGVRVVVHGEDDSGWIRARKS